MLIVNEIKKKEQADPVDQFGASDCINGCGSHLFYLGCKDFKSVLKKVIRTYDYLNLDPKLRAFN